MYLRQLSPPDLETETPTKKLLFDQSSSHENQRIENNIKQFFGNEFLICLYELDRIIRDNDPTTLVLSEEDPPDKIILKSLIDDLVVTPDRIMSKREAREDFCVNSIENRAIALKEALEKDPMLWQQARKWVTTLLTLIGAALGAFAGFTIGAALSTPPGGVALAAPASKWGAAVGGAVGTFLGGYLTYKGTLATTHFFSHRAAKADLSERMLAIVQSKMAPALNSGLGAS